MPDLNIDYLEELEKYFASGDLAFDFKYAQEKKKHQILEFLEKLMDLGELSDQIATEVIFKDSYLSMMTGVKDQK